MESSARTCKNLSRPRRNPSPEPLLLEASYPLGHTRVWSTAAEKCSTHTSHVRLCGATSFYGFSPYSRLSCVPCFATVTFLALSIFAFPTFPFLPSWLFDLVLWSFFVCSRYIYIYNIIYWFSLIVQMYWHTMYKMYWHTMYMFVFPLTSSNIV